MPPKPAKQTEHQTFGSRVRDRRVELGLSQEAIAGFIGMNVSYVASLERGERNPSLSSFLWLAYGLEIDPAELVKGLGVYGIKAPQHTPSKGPAKKQRVDE
jgi:transcriptional regulator with XRE-family HTH domain